MKQWLIEQMFNSVERYNVSNYWFTCMFWELVNGIFVYLVNSIQIRENEK